MLKLLRGALERLGFGHEYFEAKKSWEGIHFGDTCIVKEVDLTSDLHGNIDGLAVLPELRVLHLTGANLGGTYSP